MMYKKIYKNMCFLSMMTLIVASVMILSACYTVFNSRFKDEMKSEALMIGDFLNDSENIIDAVDNAAKHYGEKRITLISPEGKVVYDNDAEIDNLKAHNNRPEVKQARKSGIGESERYSMTTGKKLYYYAVKLADGSVLRVATASKNVFVMFYGVIIAVLFIAALLYILSVIIAIRLTDNIVKPIEKVYSLETDNYDDVYEEIQPFLRRISKQNQEIKRQMNKVKAQKLRLQTITDNMNEGLVIIGKDSKILSLNSCAMDIFKIKTGDLLNSDFSQLTANKDIQSAFAKAICGEKDNILVKIGVKTYQIFYSPVYEKIEISGVVMLLFDVSEKAESEEIRREFSANVSHELKTPLTTIHGYAQIIDSGIAKQGDIKGFALKIEKESSRLIALIDDIIELSNLDENTSGYEKQDISMRAVIEEVTETLQSKADERGIGISLKGKDTRIHANLSQITELVFNLIDNAIKYNKENGTVKIALSEKELIVADTGIGIPEEYLGRIFERFFRVDKSHSKKVNGTGLGLSIVKHIAQVNNATISVESEIDRGTIFTVHFES